MGRTQQHRWFNQSLQMVAVLGIVFALMSAATPVKACIGGRFEVGDITLMPSSASKDGQPIDYPPIKPEMRNKKIDKLLSKSNDLEIRIVYVLSAKNSEEVAATFYAVKQRGYEDMIIRVNSNVSESGVRTRSLRPQAETTGRDEPPKEEPPKADEVFGCGGGSTRHGLGSQGPNGTSK